MWYSIIYTQRFIIDVVENLGLYGDLIKKVGLVNTGLILLSFLGNLDVAPDELIKRLAFIISVITINKIQISNEVLNLFIFFGSKNFIENCVVSLLTCVSRLRSDGKCNVS